MQHIAPKCRTSHSTSLKKKLIDKMTKVGLPKLIKLFVNMSFWCVAPLRCRFWLGKYFVSDAYASICFAVCASSTENFRRRIKQNCEINEFVLHIMLLYNLHHFEKMNILASSSFRFCYHLDCRFCEFNFWNVHAQFKL